MAFLALFALAAAGCAAPSQREAAASALMDAYTSAHDAADTDGLRALVHWEGVSEERRARMEERLIRHIGKPVAHISFTPVDEEKRGFLDRYNPNITAVGIMGVMYETPPEDSRAFAAIYIVGEVGGRYVIAVSDE